jgi:hypothetical protein
MNVLPCRIYFKHLSQALYGQRSLPCPLQSFRKGSQCTEIEIGEHIPAGGCPALVGVSWKELAGVESTSSIQRRYVSQPQCLFGRVLEVIRVNPHCIGNESENIIRELKVRRRPSRGQVWLERPSRDMQGLGKAIQG